MNMIGNIVNIISSRVAGAGSAGMQKVDTVTEASAQTTGSAETWGVHGVVSRPADGARALRLRLGSLNLIIGVYRYDIAPPANAGATSIYSTNESGAQMARADLDNDGKIALYNDVEDLKTLIDTLLDEIIAIQTTGSPTNHTLNPASIANFNTLKTRVSDLLKEAV